MTTQWVITEPAEAIIRLLGLGSKLYPSNMPRQELITCNRLLATHAQQRSYSILEYAKRVCGQLWQGGTEVTESTPPPPAFPDLNPCPIVIDAITRSMSCQEPI